MEKGKGERRKARESRTVDARNEMIFITRPILDIFAGDRMIGEIFGGVSNFELSQFRFKNGNLILDGYFKRCFIFWKFQTKDRQVGIQFFDEIN